MDKFILQFLTLNHIHYAQNDVVQIANNVRQFTKTLTNEILVSGRSKEVLLLIVYQHLRQNSSIKHTKNNTIM